MPDNQKEVMFCKYCDKCKYKDLLDFEEPCNTCLEIPVQISTEKPVCFSEQK